MKSELLTMEVEYERIQSLEDHIRHDYEQYLYDRYFRIADVRNAFKSYAVQKGMTTGQSATEGITHEVAGALLNDIAFKNGFSLAIINYEELVVDFEELGIASKRLVKRIDEELKFE